MPEEECGVVTVFGRMLDEKKGRTDRQCLRIQSCISADNAAVEQSLQVVVLMRFATVEYTFHIWQVGYFTASRLIVNHTNAFLLVTSHGVESVDGASDGSLPNFIALMDIEIAENFIF